MRITKLYIKRPLLNRLSYWLYDKFCREPYFPKGRVCVSVTRTKGGDNCRISFIPDSFIPGIHEYYSPELTIVDLKSRKP